MISGIINLYKEAGYTSHDAVARLRGIVRQRRIGHTGTLDPDARGVLPVCLGSATKLCGMLTDESKEYEAVLRLGVTTDTQDMSGQILEQRSILAGGEEVRAAVQSFAGEYDQVPPMYSALKVDGKKLYELAREGKTVERKPRRVKIYRIEVLAAELPLVTMRIECSKGTYIRSLCQDIGDRLGCGGAMQSLVRTRVGRFCLEGAVTLSQIERLCKEGRLQETVLPVDVYFDTLPARMAKEEYGRRLENGNALKGPAFPEQEGQDGARIRAYLHDGRFCGIYEWSGADMLWKPVKMFLERDV